MLCAPLTKSAVTNVPASKTSGKNHLHRLWPVAFFAAEAGGQPKLATGATQQSGRGLGQQSFPGPIHQLQALLTIEGEYRDINFRHHGAQKCICFKRADSL